MLRFFAAAAMFQSGWRLSMTSRIVVQFLPIEYGNSGLLLISDLRFSFISPFPVSVILIVASSKVSNSAVTKLSGVVLPLAFADANPKAV